MSSPPPLLDRVRGSHLLRVLAVYLSVAFVVLQVVDLFTDGLGLPSWFFVGAVVLLVAGLPIVLATALAQDAVRRPQAERAPDHDIVLDDAPRRSALRRWLTWRHALVGGTLAFGLLVAAVAVAMGLRAAGIGPGASLVAAGVLGERERLARPWIVAEQPAPAALRRPARPGKGLRASRSVAGAGAAADGRRLPLVGHRRPPRGLACLPGDPRERPRRRLGPEQPRPRPLRRGRALAGRKALRARGPRRLDPGLGAVDEPRRGHRSDARLRGGRAAARALRPRRAPSPARRRDGAQPGPGPRGLLRGGAPRERPRVRREPVLADGGVARPRRARHVARPAVGGRRPHARAHRRERLGPGAAGGVGVRETRGADARAGDAEAARAAYARVVDLWKDADPELQPRVEAARREIHALRPLGSPSG